MARFDGSVANVAETGDIVVLGIVVVLTPPLARRCSPWTPWSAVSMRSGHRRQRRRTGIRPPPGSAHPLVSLHIIAETQVFLVGGRPGT